MSEQVDERDDEAIGGNPRNYPQFLKRILLNLWPLVVLAFIMAAVIIWDHHFG